MNQTLYQAAAVIIPMILAIVFHEVAHGWMALALGDPTAKERKRLTLNPIRHVDPIGTIVLPGFLTLVGAPVLGWAKPVPVRKSRLRNPRFGMMAVAAAGPGTNFALAALAAIALGLFAGNADLNATTGDWRHFLTLNLFYFLIVNVSLALFNLLPIPPFDGSHIVEGLLPERAARGYERLRPLGFPLIIGLLVVLPWLVPSFDPLRHTVVPIFEWVVGHYLALADMVSAR
jgi:Zn-dependent protease